MKQANFKSIIIIFAVIGFASIVTVLHVVQKDYDATHQLMSELALGDYGTFMSLAFFFFAIALFSAQHILADYKNGLPVRVMFLVSSCSFAGAGVFELGKHTNLHISFVAVAFILIVLSMYLLPRLVVEFRQRSAVIICWSSGLGIAIIVASGQVLIPLGIAQRGAAGLILTWLIWFACFHQIQLNMRKR